MEKRAPWFKENIPVFFGTGEIFSRYRPSGVPQIRKRFTEAGAIAKHLYNIREYKGGQSGNRSGENNPIFTHLFFEYFAHVATCESSTKNTRIVRQRHGRVNMSLVRQQAASSSN